MPTCDRCGVPYLPDDDDTANVRLSLFSAWSRPEHRIIERPRDLPGAIREARDAQYGVVLTWDDEPEPDAWRGPGVDDRR